MHDSLSQTEKKKKRKKITAEGCELVTIWGLWYLTTWTNSSGVSTKLSPRDILSHWYYAHAENNVQCVSVFRQGILPPKKHTISKAITNTFAEKITDDVPLHSRGPTVYLPISLPRSLLMSPKLTALIGRSFLSVMTPLSALQTSSLLSQLHFCWPLSQAGREEMRVMFPSRDRTKYLPEKHLWTNTPQDTHPVERYL